LGSILLLLSQSLTRKFRRKKKKDVFKPIKASATPALPLLNRNELSVSLEGASRLALPGHTDACERGKRDSMDAAKEV